MDLELQTVGLRLTAGPSESWSWSRVRPAGAGGHRHSGDAEHADALALRAAAQFPVSAVEEADTGGKSVTGNLRAGAREEHLTAGPEPTDTRRPVERRTVIVAVALERLAGMHRDAHAYREIARPRLGGEGALDVRRGRDRVAGAAEHRQGRVAFAFGLDEDTAGLADDVLDDAVVALQREGHRFGVAFPEAGRTLDVGEEEGDDAARESGGGSWLGGWRRLGGRCWPRGLVVDACQLFRLADDRLLEFLERRAGLDAHFLGQCPAKLLVDAERFHLSTRAVQRQHALTP